MYDGIRQFVNEFLQFFRFPIDKRFIPCYTGLNQWILNRKKEVQSMKNYFESLVRANYRCGRMFSAWTDCAGCFVVPFSSVRLH